MRSRHALSRAYGTRCRRRPSGGFTQQPRRSSSRTRCGRGPQRRLLQPHSHSHHQTGHNRGPLSQVFSCRHRASAAVAASQQGSPRNGPVPSVYKRRNRLRCHFTSGESRHNASLRHSRRRSSARRKRRKRHPFGQPSATSRTQDIGTLPA